MKTRPDSPPAKAYLCVRVDPSTSPPILVRVGVFSSPACGLSDIGPGMWCDVTFWEDQDYGEAQERAHEAIRAMPQFKWTLPYIRAGSMEDHEALYTARKRIQEREALLRCLSRALDQEDGVEDAYSRADDGAGKIKSERHQLIGAVENTHSVEKDVKSVARLCVRNSDSLEDLKNILGRVHGLLEPGDIPSFGIPEGRAKPPSNDLKLFSWNETHKLVCDYSETGSGSHYDWSTLRIIER